MSSDSSDSRLRTGAKRVGGAVPADAEPYRFIVVLIVLLGWMVITVGIAFGAAEATQNYQMLTLVIAVLVSRIWGTAVSKLAARQQQ